MSHRYFGFKNLLFVANRIIQPKGRPQSIILTGVSGAGKTESASHILSFIGESSLSNQIKESISAANHIFALFGNASTGLNKNSSRFTKLTEVSIFHILHRIVFSINLMIFYHLFICIGIPDELSSRLASCSIFLFFIGKQQNLFQKQKRKQLPHIAFNQIRCQLAQRTLPRHH